MAYVVGERLQGLFLEEEVDGGKVGGDEGNAGFEEVPVEERCDS